MAEENTPGSGELPKEPEPSASEPALPVAGVPASSDSAAAGKAPALTPGQRLAAKKAQKAVDKREAKEERKRAEEETRKKEEQEAERLFGRVQPTPGGLPEDVEKVAGSFTHLLQDNKERILIGLGAVLALLAVGLGAQRFFRSGAAEQAAQLGRALEIANGPVDRDDEDGKTDDGKPIYKSEKERATKALAAFEETVKAGAERSAGTWAKLAMGASAMQLEQYEQARAQFQSVADAHAADPALATRALEGVALALEAADKPAEALKALEKLKGIASAKMLADYHTARIKIAQGDRDTGKSLLKALYDQLVTPAEGAPPAPYLKTEVEMHLAEIDPSLVDKGSFSGEPQMMTEEQIQRLIEQLGKKGKGAP